MGQAALKPNAIDALPDVVDEVTARAFCGACWDDAEWETLSAATPGAVSKNVFKAAVQVRNHAPSLRTWLEFWRIDELTVDLEELQVMCADDLCDLEPARLRAFEQRLKKVQRAHWQKAMAHATYLQAHPLGYMPWRPCALRMWLESWRLQRVEPALRELGVGVKEDLLDLDEAEWARLGMRLLEAKRFAEAVENLTHLLKAFNFAAQRKASVTTFPTWLASLRLTALRPQLEAMGAYELMDLADIDDATLASFKLSNLQAKHWQLGVNQILAAKREAMADGHGDLPNLRGVCEAWRLLRLWPLLLELGALVQQDLLDLEPHDYALLQMRPLEARRFDQMLAALEEEFDTPPPGEEWTEHNMTRRAWRKQQSISYGFEDKKVKRQQSFREVASGIKVVSSHMTNKYTQNLTSPNAATSAINSESSRGVRRDQSRSNSKSRDDNPNGATRMSTTAPAANARANARAAGPGSQGSRSGRL